MSMLDEGEGVMCKCKDGASASACGNQDNKPQHRSKLAEVYCACGQGNKATESSGQLRLRLRLRPTPLDQQGQACVRLAIYIYRVLLTTSGRYRSAAASVLPPGGDLLLLLRYEFKWLKRSAFTPPRPAEPANLCPARLPADFLLYCAFAPQSTRNMHLAHGIKPALWKMQTDVRLERWC